MPLSIPNTCFKSPGAILRSPSPPRLFTPRPQYGWASHARISVAAAKFTLLNTRFAGMILKNLRPPQSRPYLISGLSRIQFLHVWNFHTFASRNSRWRKSAHGIGNVQLNIRRLARGRSQSLVRVLRQGYRSYFHHVIRRSDMRMIQYCLACKHWRSRFWAFFMSDSSTRE